MAVNVEEIILNRKIEKVREDIKKTEARIRELQEYLKTLQIQERQLCDEEIAKAVREMAGKGDVLETLKKIQQKQNEVYAGTVSGGREMEEHV